MADLRLKINSAGIKALLTSPGLAADLTARAEAVRHAAGSKHHIVDTQSGPNRARAAVITSTYEGMRREATDRNLVRAIDAAR